MNRTVIQNINSPVYGHVVGGDLTFIEHPPQERELTWWDINSDELGMRLKALYAELWGSWRRYWFNPPFFILGLHCLGLLALVLNMITNLHSANSFFMTITKVMSPMWFVILNGVLMLPVAHWLQKIRRLEANVAAHAQADIDGIKLVLRRRKNHQ